MKNLEATLTINAPATTDLNVDVPVAPVQPEVRERTRPVFTGLEDHTIALDDAAELTRNYRKSAGKGAIKGGFFGRAALEQVLSQEGVVGIRYYYAQENNGRPVLILVGVDENGKDLVDGFMAERAMPCPPFCSPWNPLNS
ncbi:hypothetical protein KQI65_01710 [bacterium]|nr:hypothetical protein [bacterium]MCB2203437.1 hypothetical protein [bacterium]